MAEQSVGLLARRRARGLWVRGAKQLGFGRTGEETGTPDKPAALDTFTRALELDPGMTDAWLGFHAAGETRTPRWIGSSRASTGSARNATRTSGG